MKKIGFLSFGHWSPSSQSQTRSAADALLQSIDLAAAAERICDCDEGDQWPKERKPIFFMYASCSLQSLLRRPRDWVQSNLTQRSVNGADP